MLETIAQRALLLIPVIVVGLAILASCLVLLPRPSRLIVFGTYLSFWSVLFLATTGFAIANLIQASYAILLMAQGVSHWFYGPIAARAILLFGVSVPLAYAFKRQRRPFLTILSENLFPLLILIVAAFLHLSPIMSPLDLGETTYYLMAQDCLSDWDKFLVPMNTRYGPNPYPPLAIWIATISLQIFEVSPWAFRLPYALLGTGTVFLVYVLGKELYGRKVGLASSLVLAAILYIMRASIWLFDGPLTFFITLAFYFLYSGYAQRRMFLILVGGVATGLGLFTEAWVGLAPLAAFMLFCALNSTFRKRVGTVWFLIKATLVGLVTSFTILLPWMTHATYYWKELWGSGFLFRYMSPGELSILLIPLSTSIAYILYRRTDVDILLLTWLWTLLLAFQLASIRIFAYVLPIAPALSLLIGAFLVKGLSGSWLGEIVGTTRHVVRLSLGGMTRIGRLLVRPRNTGRSLLISGLAVIGRATRITPQDLRYKLSRFGLDNRRSLVFIMSIAALFRFWETFIATQQCDVDEGTYLRAATYSLTHVEDLIVPGLSTYRPLPPIMTWFPYPFLKFFGTSIVAFRFPFALLGIGTVYIVYLLGKELYGTRAGVISAFVLSVMPYHIMRGGVGLPDGPVTFFIALSAYLLYCGLTKKKQFLVLASGVSVGMGFLTKYWPAIFPYLFLSIFFLLSKDFRRKVGTFGFFIKNMFLSVLFAIAVCVPYILNFGYLETVSGFAMSYPKWGFSALLSPYFLDIVFTYFWGLAIMLFPLAGSFIHAALRRREGDTLSLAWFLTVLLIFQSAAQKFFVYLVPIAPAASLLIGGFLEHKKEKSDRRARLSMNLLLISIILQFLFWSNYTFSLPSLVGLNPASILRNLGQLQGVDLFAISILDIATVFASSPPLIGVVLLVAGLLATLIYAFNTKLSESKMRRILSLAIYVYLAFCLMQQLVLMLLWWQAYYIH